MTQINFSPFRGKAYARLALISHIHFYFHALEKVNILKLKLNRSRGCLNIHEGEGYMNAFLSWMVSSYELCHVSALSTAPCRAFISLCLCH